MKFHKELERRRYLKAKEKATRAQLHFTADELIAIRDALMCMNPDSDSVCRIRDAAMAKVERVMP